MKKPTMQAVAPTGFTAWLTGLPGRVRVPNDRVQAAMRPALRAAILLPATLAFAMYAIGDKQLTPFAAFGCFSLLVMADFGGSRLPRARAYVVTALVASGMIALGTAVSLHIWLAVLVMFAVAFVVQFGGVFGGYVASAQTALLLAFVLSVSLPASPGAIPARLGGWLLAAGVSIPAALFLWPRFEHVRLREKASEAMYALAALIRTLRIESQPHPERERRQASAAVQEAKEAYRSTRMRSAGAARRNRAFVQLLTEVDRTLHFVNNPFRTSLAGTHPSLVEGDLLADSVVRTLEDSGNALAGRGLPDLRALYHAWMAHRTALDRWASQRLGEGVPPDDVLEALSVEDALRAVAYLTLAMGTNVTILSDREPPEEVGFPAGSPRRNGTGGAFLRLTQAISTHLSPSSSVLHGSLRAGFGLALAVLIARTLKLENGFWVVLGTLSVLRSNALSTGRTTVEALVGAVVGFAIAGLFTALVGTSTVALWIALPIAIFVAAFGSNAVGFVAGQAGFTIFVIIVFNLLSPLGWRLGIARVEDVAIGTAISVVVGLLLWPRGARRALVVEVSRLYDEVADYLDVCFRRVLHLPGGASPQIARERAEKARDRAGEALDQYLAERGAKPLDAESAGRLVSSGTDAILAGDLINVVAGLGYMACACEEGVSKLESQMDGLLNEVQRLSRVLLNEAVDPAGPIGVSESAVRSAELACLTHWGEDDDDGRAAVAVVAAGEWLEQLGGEAQALEGPVKRAAEAASIPWWR